MKRLTENEEIMYRQYGDQIEKLQKGKSINPKVLRLGQQQSDFMTNFNIKEEPDESERNTPMSMTMSKGIIGNKLLIKNPKD